MCRLLHAARPYAARVFPFAMSAGLGALGESSHSCRLRCYPGDPRSRHCWGLFRPETETGAEKTRSGKEGVPQGLKADVFSIVYGPTEAASENRFKGKAAPQRLKPNSSQGSYERPEGRPLQQK
jgi:hypothetical protein